MVKDFSPSLWKNTVWGIRDSLGCTENGAPHNLLRAADHANCWRCGEWFKDQSPTLGEFTVGFSTGNRVRFFIKSVEAIAGKLRFSE